MPVPTSTALSKPGERKLKRRTDGADFRWQALPYSTPKIRERNVQCEGGAAFCPVDMAPHTSYLLSSYSTPTFSRVNCVFAHVYMHTSAGWRCHSAIDAIPPVVTFCTRFSEDESCWEHNSRVDINLLEHINFRSRKCEF